MPDKAREASAFVSGPSGKALLGVRVGATLVVCVTTNGRPRLDTVDTATSLNWLALVSCSLNAV